jgi:hypothetical protein
MMLDPRVHTWLRFMNAKRYSVFVSINAIRPGTRARTKHAIGAIRHMFLDADRDAPQLLATIATRRDLPPPSYVVHSSPGRIHVLWRVTSFTSSRAEHLQRHLVRELGTDLAATPCSQTTRLPGYRNYKHGPSAPIVTVDYGMLDRYKATDFPTPSAAVNRPVLRPTGGSSSLLDVSDRVQRYLSRVEPAVAGDHGDLHTYHVCCRVVRGFDLTDDEAFAVLLEWKARCSPPWSEIELRCKIGSVRRNGREPIGRLHDRA